MPFSLKRKHGLCYTAQARGNYCDLGNPATCNLVIFKESQLLGGLKLWKKNDN